jgi:hypothetical protein
MSLSTGLSCGNFFSIACPSKSVVRFGSTYSWSLSLPAFIFVRVRTNIWNSLAFFSFLTSNSKRPAFWNSSSSISSRTNDIYVGHGLISTLNGVTDKFALVFLRTRIEEPWVFFSLGEQIDICSELPDRYYLLSRLIRGPNPGVKSVCCFVK